MTRTVAILALGGAATAAVTAIALLSRSQSAPSAPAKQTCPVNPNVAATPPMAYSAGFAQTGTTLTINVGDTLRVHLLRPGSGAGTQWTLTMDDDSELHLDKQTTGPELGSPFGTSDIWEFTAVAPGAVNLTGSVGGSWHMQVKVVCG
jgi:predicted secreted protein